MYYVLFIIRKDLWIETFDLFDSDSCVFVLWASGDNDENLFQVILKTFQ